MKHKHAEVLHAIAEGKDVEWQSLADGSWSSVHPEARVNPIIDKHLNWRVKPEPEAEWKQKLRQAAREGKRIERYNQIAQRHLPCQITDFPDQYGFLPDEKESEYRIVPKTVTRWKWAYISGLDWYEVSRFMTEDEAKMRGIVGLQKLEYTRTEFPS